jgi:hypothetical protein
MVDHRGHHRVAGEIGPCAPRTRTGRPRRSGRTRNQAGEPAFWFGHGLGYSTWEYSKSTWEYSKARVVADDDDLGVEVTVTNTGDPPVGAAASG